MATPDFYTLEDFTSLAKVANVVYDKNSIEHKVASEQLKQGAWAKTGYWAKEVAKSLPHFKVKFKNVWSKPGRVGKQSVSMFKHYTWARIMAADAQNKDVYFTVGIDAVQSVIIIKLDYQIDDNSSLTIEQKELLQTKLRPSDNTWPFSHIIPLNQLPTYNWKRLISETVSFIKENEKHYNTLVQRSQPANERRIARVTWNTAGWVRPSGTKGKSKDKFTHEHQHGFGHEEWLFDTSKLIDGYHYAFLEPIRGYQETYEGKIFDVMLYSKEGETKKRYWIGELRNMEVISHAEAKNTEATYKKKGWYSEMQKQIEDAGGNRNSLSNWKDIDLFNIRFKPEDLKIYSDLIEIPTDEPSIKTGRYLFIKVKEDFKQPVEVKGFSFIPPSVKSNSGTSYKTGYTRQTKPVEIELFHKKISDQLCELLQQEHGKENVHPEHPSGIGSNKIDIVVKDGKEHIFYEIKTHTSLRVCLREALGQIIEYCYYTDAQNAKELIIVSHHAADASTTTYLQHLRQQFNLPLYYRQFDLQMQQLADKV